MFRVLFLSLILIGSAASVRAEKVKPIPAPTSLRTLDVIGKSSDRDLIARFEVLKIELTKDSTIRAYIINHGTKSQTQKRERQIRKAIAFHKIDPKRITIVRSGRPDYLETLIYVVPTSSEPPSQ